MKKVLFLMLLLYFCIINLSIQAQSIGDFYQGGVIFYTYPSGGGLIVDIEDLSNPHPPGGTTPLDSLLSRWGGYSDFVAGTSNDSIGAGEINTQNFMTFYPDLNGSYAVHQCVNSSRGGYNDWFLPSRNELLEIFNHKSLIDSIALLNGGHTFDEFASLYPYWSSSQTPSLIDFRYAYVVYSSQPAFDLLRSKILEYKVRAIRSFSPNAGINSKPSTNKEIIKIVNLIGQEVCLKPNTPLLYIYNDGTVERKMIIE
ncbi:MAG: hypothetical protein P8H33_01695 [Crocinitomicaceae bacterium]|nr:hypothetical protein [Crocinitomicaceae bacterium]